jgi:hypothetical protein
MTGNHLSHAARARNGLKIHLVVSGNRTWPISELLDEIKKVPAIRRDMGSVRPSGFL